MTFLVIFSVLLLLYTFIQVGWLYSVLAIVCLSAAVYLLVKLWKRTEKEGATVQDRVRARTISRIVFAVSICMAFVGIVVFFCGIGGGTDNYFADACEVCGGDGRFMSKRCSACDGTGVFISNSVTYVSTTWLGVLLAFSGGILTFVSYKLMEVGKQQENAIDT